MKTNENISSLTTEKRNLNTYNIDRVSTLEIVKIINSEDKKVPEAIEKELPKIAKAIDKISEKLTNSGRMFYVGAGTSGRLGVLDASECPPTFGIPHEKIQGIIAGGKEAVFISKEGAEDFKELAIEDLKKKQLNSKDVVVGIAASGRTPYVIGAIEYANLIGAFTISITCNENSYISEISKISINPIVGEEVITGSTRLKSGTAQKLVLNMLSTGSMIKLGKVYGNLMVDVKCTNDKLIERGKNIVVEATGVSREKALNVLEETNFDVKLSIFMILSKLQKNEAEKILEDNDGYIYKALEKVKGYT